MNKTTFPSITETIRALVITEARTDGPTQWLLNINKFNAEDDLLISSELAHRLLGLQASLWGVQMGTLMAENNAGDQTPVTLTVKSGGGSMTETSDHPDVASAQAALYQWVYSSWAEQFMPDEEWREIPADPKAAIREYFTRNKDACSYDIQQFTCKQDDDFDRDENGTLTEEGKAQLVAWSQERGLLDSPKEESDQA